MSDAASIKSSLLNTQWREYTRVNVESINGPVELVIRSPPDAVLGKLLRGAQELRGKGAEGEKTATQSEERDPEVALRWRAEVVATCVFLPNGVTPLFAVDEVLGWSGVGEVVEQCLAAINPSKALERAKGN